MIEFQIQILADKKMKNLKVGSNNFRISLFFIILELIKYEFIYTKDIVLFMAYDEVL